MKRLCFFAAALCLLTASSAHAQDAPGAMARLPVREITVFKDGNAFVLHEGRMPVDAASGAVVLDTLPNPILGTFWPYSREKNAPLVATVAGRRRVRVERTALSLRELLEANVGASVRITESGSPNPTTYDATIVGVPERSADELEATGFPPSENGEWTGQKGGLILLRTDAGVRALPIERILDVTFKEGNRGRSVFEEVRSQLRLHFGWPGGKAARTADVGLVYLQRGVRWIPGYKITLDGTGKARVQLQATLLNELADLENVVVHLVIGVPTFAFKDTPDPIGLQDTLARLSPYFDPNSSFGGQPGGGGFLSNAIMTQQARMGERAGAPAGAPNLGPEIAGGEKNEDLFVFTVRGVSLKKGQRVVLPVAEHTLTYQDVYTLDLPLGPPRELTQNVSTEQQAELARLLATPKVLHKIRLRNTSAQPLTTAPALLMSGERILAQGLMTYAAPGANADLTVTTAVDIRAKKTERETKRTPDAITMQDYRYARVDLAGAVSLTNFGKEPAALEITRTVGGLVDSADSGGVVEMINPVENPEVFTEGYLARYGWPASWWGQVNGVGRITWKLTLPAGKSADLNYAWHYFWR